MFLYIVNEKTFLSNIGLIYLIHAILQILFAVYPIFKDNLDLWKPRQPAVTGKSYESTKTMCSFKQF